MHVVLNGKNLESAGKYLVRGGRVFEIFGRKVEEVYVSRGICVGSERGFSRGLMEGLGMLDVYS